MIFVAFFCIFFTQTIRRFLRFKVAYSQIKRYCNPFGNFNWMGKNIPQFAKTVIISGLDMFHSMEMTRSAVSDELLALMERAKEGKPLVLDKSSEDVENEAPPLSKKPKEAIRVSD